MSEFIALKWMPSQLEGQTNSHCHLQIQESHKKKPRTQKIKTKQSPKQNSKGKVLGNEGRGLGRKVGGQISESIIPEPLRPGGEDSPGPPARVALARHVVLGGRLPIHPVEILVARLLGGIEPVSDRQARKGLGHGGWCGRERV